MKPYNVDGYRVAARRRLPKAVFDFVEGGAEDESTIAANRSAFASLRFLPRIHEHALPVDLSTTLCGRPVSMPLFLAPTGNVGLIHHDGERGVAVVAAGRGIVSVMSGGSSYSIE